MDQLISLIEEEFGKHDEITDIYLSKLRRTLRQKDQFMYSMYISCMMSHLHECNMPSGWVESIRYYPE
jgi:hypothetical protein